MKLYPHTPKPVTAALCVLALSPALVFAGDAAKPSEESGILKSVDQAAHTLIVTAKKKNNEQTFRWNEQTKFTQKKKKASASALKEGEQVHLAYTPGGDPPTLQSVSIAPAKGRKHSGLSPSLTRSTGS